MKYSVITIARTLGAGGEEKESKLKEASAAINAWG